jgi:hypothetical protein
MTAAEARAREPRVEEAGGRKRRIASRSSIVLAALLLTLLNAYKPLTIDDAAYYEYATHIAQHPQDPYGFEIFWGERPQPAFEVLAAPLLPYWWAGALRLFGDRPVLWKLSLFPFALLLAVSLYYLLARFARGLERPLLWLMILSPAVLPSFNLMLDVPALALSLASLSLFMSACHGGRWGRVVTAGLLAGLAMQTKQTSITAVVVLLAYGMIFERLRLALLAAAVAAAVFAGWELLMVLQYGDSHFLHARAVRSASVSLRGIGLLSLGFTSLLGGVAAVAVPLGLLGLRAPRWLVPGAILLGSLAFAAIPFFPAESLPQLYMSPWLDEAPPEQYVFTALGCGVLLVAIAVGWRLLAARAGSDNVAGRAVSDTLGEDASAARRIDPFLLGWLLIELVGCYAIWTFLASRHVIRLATVLVLVCGRAAAATRSPGGDRRPLGWVVAWGIGVGLLFFAADLSDALARRDAVRRAADQLVTLGVDRERERVWYLGHWGFQFYAESLGMKPVVPGSSHLEAGDWLVAPDGVSRQQVWIPTTRVTREALVESRSPWPWSSIPSFYAGPIPLRSQPEAQVVVRLYRVERGFQATGSATWRSQREP